MTVPRGSNSNMVMTMVGAGSGGVNKGPRGDLNVRIIVKEDETFHRSGDDLMIRISISISDAVLGDKRKVETVYGNEIDIDIKPGTKDGDLVILKGYGCPSVRDNQIKGKMVVVFNIDIPKQISEEQKQLFKKLRKHERKIK